MKSLTRADIEALRKSPIFDEQWYLINYPDVALLQMDAAEHFLKYGELLRRAPGPNATATDFPWLGSAALNFSLPKDDAYTRISKPLSSDPMYLAARYAQGPLQECEPAINESVVSVIIPSFNNAEYLGQAIHSALSQNGVKLEVIVVDDGSSDNSVAIANEIASRHKRVRPISLLRNFGCYYARNIGIKEARGDFIAFLDSDDIMHPDRLRIQLKYLLDNPNVYACRCQLRRWTLDFSKPLNEIKYGENGILCRRDLFEAIGYFDTVKYSADAEFRMRLKRKLTQSALFDMAEELYYCRTTAESLTMRKDSSVFTMNGSSLEVSLSPARQRYADNFEKWQKETRDARGRLYLPFPLHQRPFPLGERKQNASPSIGVRRVGTMATFPGRSSTFRNVVERILPQLDELIIYLNEYSSVPDLPISDKIRIHLGTKTAGDLRDNGKFYQLPTDDAYIFTFDDDINYPHDYVDRMIHYIEMFQRSCVVGVHGVIFPREKREYLRDRNVTFFGAGHKGRFVDLLGTGTTAFHSSTLSLKLQDFKTKGICDLWFALACHNQKVPLFSVPRVKGWLTPMEVSGVRLFDEARARNSEHTSIYHQNLFPILDGGAKRRVFEELLLQTRGPEAIKAAKIELLEAAQPISLVPATRTIRPFQVDVATVPARAKSSLTHFHLVLNGWNCDEYVYECLRSVADQRLGQFTVQYTVVDDGSSDNTFSRICNTSLLPNAKIIRGNVNRGPAYARHIAIQQINDPETIVVLVDLDDALEPNALEVVERRYQRNPECLMTIGNWHNQNGKLNPQPFYTTQELDNQKVREIDMFHATHLRTFRRKLYDAIDEQDLLGPDGKWLETCTDVAIMFPLLDQCWARNVEFIKEPIYKYNQQHASGTLARFGKPHKVARLEWLRAKPKKPRLR